jgi:hypothetical protein
VIYPPGWTFTPDGVMAVLFGAWVTGSIAGVVIAVIASARRR